MNRSPGGAAAQGLETGFNIGLRMQGMQRDEEDRAERRKLQGEDREWLRQERTAATSERERRLRIEDEDRTLKTLDDQAQALRSEFEGYSQRYGQAIPADIDASYRQRVQRVLDSRDTIFRQRLQGAEREMQDVLGLMTTDPAALNSVEPRRFTRALVTALRRDPRDLLGDGDRPSRVDQAVTEVMSGLQSGNQLLLLRGANVLLEPELKMGVGQASPHGGKIIAKRVHAMVPHPEKPGEFTPVLRVYISDGKIDTPDEEARARQIAAEDPDAPPEATGYYMAPVTENRSTDPNDPVKSISVERAMDYAARMQTLSKALSSNPRLRRKIEEGVRDEGPALLRGVDAFYALGGRMATKQVSIGQGSDLVTIDESGRELHRVPGLKPPAKLTRERIDVGDGVVETTYDETGKPVGERRIRKGAAPARGGESSGTGSTTRSERESLAVRLGVPMADRDPYAGMSAKAADVFKRTLYAQADKKLTEADEAVSSARSMAQDVQRFLELQDKVSMQGPVVGRTWAMSSEAQEMDAISDRITPQMRQPGSGATSDFDAKMFKSATVSRTKNEGANQAIAQAVILRAQDVADRAQFMRDFLTVNGHLDGADRQWATYLRSNPIFDPESTDEPRLNPGRVSYQQFFTRQPAGPGAPAAPSASGAGAAALPQAARARLREGTVTTFGNGQRWTLQGGQPVQVQ